ncbi:MAG TPA: DUF2188 domain-containing protein [Gammaproteobacteria bacterium]|nr:DUF2188 domain-containing protein [Gammaproteobacteria bacterium]
MNRKKLHILVNPNGGWDVVLTPARDLAHFAEREAALAFARRKARVQHLDLVVHDADGGVVATEVYDPSLQASRMPPTMPPKGTGGR